MRNPIFICSIMLLIVACDTSGEKVMDEGPLKVYYNDSSDQKVIAAFYDFWIKEQYVGDKTQSIKITENAERNVYEVRIILRKEFDPATTIDFKELQLMSEIQQELNTHVFMKKKCELVICDNKFQTLSAPMPIIP